MISKKQQILNLLKALTFICCTFLFFFMSYGIFNQYQDKDTIVVTSVVPVKTFHVPDIVICLKNPYLGDTEHLFTKTSYLNSTIDVADLILRYGFANVQDPARANTKWEVYDIFTIVHGRCKVLHPLSQVSQVNLNSLFESKP